MQTANFMPSLKLCQVFLQQPASPYSSSTTSLIILISYCRVACPFSPFFLTFNLQLHANSFLFLNLPPVIPPPPYCISNHHTSLSPPPLPARPLPSSLLRVGVQLRLYFPFWYCIVNALLHPIQLRCRGNTV